MMLSLQPHVAKAPLAAIERDLPRGGRPPKADAAEIVWLATQTLPETLNTLDGSLITCCQQCHRHEEFTAQQAAMSSSSTSSSSRRKL
jgi:hypothetical protein